MSFQRRIVNDTRKRVRVERPAQKIRPPLSGLDMTRLPTPLI
jgi:hypothetical protein